MTAPVEIVQSTRLLLPLAVTLLAPFAIWVLGRHPNGREAASFAASALTLAAVLWMLPGILQGRIFAFTLFTIRPGIHVSVRADGLSMIFGIVSSLLWFVTTAYNVGYMRTLKEHAQTRYYFCFAVAIFGAQGVAFSGNIFTLYLFYEIITMFTYPLVAHHQDAEAYAGGRKYIVYLMGSSKLFFLPAMVITYLLCGTLEFHMGDIVQGIFPASADPTLVSLAYWLYFFGLAKSAVMPLHNWLPSAMVAPTPVSALLHAVAVVKAGVAAIARVVLSGFGVAAMTSHGLGLPTAYLAAFTIVAASLIALTKDDIKARLAYSTISQLSYIVIGVAMLTPMALEGGIVHLVNHAFSKITLFFAAGAIFVASRQRKISTMGGLGRRMPWTFGAFAVASLSMIGVPPACGFVTKWYLVNGAIHAGYMVLLAALLVSTLLNAMYFTPVVLRGFFGRAHPDVSLEQCREAPVTMVAALCFTAVMSVVLGIFPQLVTDFIKVFTHLLN
ncbi:MAG: monovalent cation/H+ antiporter subunit D family protein [Desulfosarcinaceae bacterium]